MPIQIGLLAETTIAEWTFKGFFLVMNIAHMSLQIGTDAKGPFAIFAFVRLLASMRA